MEVKPTISSEDLATLFECALRYALPRHTYITSVICEIITRNVGMLTPQTIARMLIDIDCQLEYDSTMHKCDRDEFIKLRNVLVASSEFRYSHDNDGGCR